MERIKIYYHKETKNFQGAGNIAKINDGKGNFILEYPQEEYDFIEILFSEWIDFWKQNIINKQIYIEDKKLKSKPIVISLERLKRTAIDKRNHFLKKMLEDNFEDLGNMTEEMKKKVKLARKEINEIEKATEETIDNF